MKDAARTTTLPPEPALPVEPVEELASAYLAAARGDAAEALRLAVADRMAQEERVRAVGALVSRGFARWGQARG